MDGVVNEGWRLPLNATSAESSIPLWSTRMMYLRG